MAESITTLRRRIARRLKENPDVILKTFDVFFESSIQEKKDYINTTQKTIRKLDEGIQQKQATVKFIKENTKNHQHTGSLLLQYEKTLEAELEKRRDSYNQDMTIFQERIESYRSVFQQHKDRYCMNSLAQKLLKVQVKNEEIEKRIRATESQITEKERELTAALEDCSDPTMTVEEFSEEKQSETAGSEDMSECDTEMFNYSSWQKTHSAGDQINEGDQKRSEEVKEQVKSSSGSEVTVETLEENDGGDVEKTRADILEDTTSEGVICPPPSPARMKAVLTTPTFSLNNSPVGSPGRPDGLGSNSPAFVFSVNSAPNTPAFSRLACDFDMGSTAEEASPFTFTSSYFSDKKSPGSGPKFSGFLFDEGENHQEEFSFSFSSESPQQNSSTQPTEGPDDSFPFTFSFS
ncbi:hypothetical protein E1301_Tti016481 [Triplophysa tibetana]|uniref:Protein SIX6OS1 n=1 Tax=Triplophysa tibetana TaxID=1572043 RepID=A0A5A9P2N6_9TELE|nr:hypothetical protein E1301_Tti016481 [Triplophysa tibetana]